jgi:hypothetical protein
LLFVQVIYGAYIYARIDQQAIICEIVIGPRDRPKLDSLQVLTQCLNVTRKAAGSVQLDRGMRKG